MSEKERPQTGHLQAKNAEPATKKTITARQFVGTLSDIPDNMRNIVIHELSVIAGDTSTRDDYITAYKQYKGRVV